MRWRYLFMAWYVIGLLLMLFFHIPKWLVFSNGWFLVFYALSVLELEAARVESWGKLFLFILPIGVLTFCLEAFGTATGFPFGAYHYLGTLGHLFWRVPYTIVFAWIGVLTNTILISTQSSRILRALEVGFWVVLLDLVLDPVAFVKHFWIWETKGFYYGVPLENYFGWFGAAALLSFLFPLNQVGRHEKRWAERLYQMMLVMFGLLSIKYRLPFSSLFAAFGILLIEGRRLYASRQQKQMV